MKPPRGSPLNRELQRVMGELGLVLRTIGNLRAAVARAEDAKASATLLVALYQKQRELHEVAERVLLAWGDSPAAVAEVR